MGGAQFPFGDLLGIGSSQSSGDSFVAKAVNKIQKARDDVAALLSLTTPPSNLTTSDGLLFLQWREVKKALDPVFNTNSTADSNPTTRVRSATPAQEDILDEIDEILAALSSVDAFVAATAKDGGGVFESAERTTSQATSAFDRVDWTAMATLGATGSTRYGTVIRKQTDDAQTGAKYQYIWNDADTDSVVDFPEERDSVGEFGAFSYATMQETQRTMHVQNQSGIATYTGGTHAINPAGTSYTGDMRVQIRFSSKKVSGVVSNLTDADGQPWRHNFTDVASIILPDGDLKANAKWTGAASASKPAYINYTSASGVVAPHRETVNAKFEGILLGQGAAAGNEANGSWSIGALANDSDNSAYLAGAFGVTRGDDAARPLPDQDDGSSAKAKMFYQVTGTATLGTGVTSKTNAAISGGELKLTLDALGYRPGTPGDNTSTMGYGVVWQSKGTGYEAKINSETFDLATLVASGSVEKPKGPTHVSQAIKVIEQQRDILTTLNGLPDSTANDNAKAAAWQRVQQEFEFRVFGKVPTKLANTWANSKDDAMSLIDRALDALASNEALEAAIDGDGTGIFKDTTNLDPATADGATKEVKVNGRTAANIRAELEYQVFTQLGSTSYTRFGVWRHAAWRNAVRSGSDSDAQDSDGTQALVGAAAVQGPGTLAYSLLDPTLAASVDASYPVNGKASYTGETVAVAHTQILTGEIEANVNWGNGGANDNLAGNTAKLALTIRNLQNANGDMLSDTAAVTKPIAEIVISDLSIVAGTDSTDDATSPGKNNGQLIVGSAGNAAAFDETGTVRLNLLDPSEPQITGSDGDVKALFVGKDADGPLGVIGFWKLEDASVGLINAAGTGHVSGSAGWTIYGAFGADAP